MGKAQEVFIRVRVDMGEIKDELRRIEEELYEAAQQVDPYMPSQQQWQTHPWARYHTVDENGQGMFWRNGGIVLGADGWYQDEDTLQQYEEGEIYDVRNCGPWEESLRVRPAWAL